MEYDPKGYQYPADSVLLHPSRNFIESTSKERHLQYNKSNESVSERAQAGGTNQRTMTDSMSPPAVTDNGWTLVPSDTSITGSGLSSGDGDTGPRPNVAAVSNGLTTDNLMLHNMMLEKSVAERLWEQQQAHHHHHRSNLATKGTATRTSDDSVELLGPWALLNNPNESDILAVGSWADPPGPPPMTGLSLY